MPPGRDLKVMALMAALFLGLFGAVEFAGVSADVLLAAPLAVLVVPLLGGRYLGEEQIARLRAAFGGRPRRVRAAAAVVPRGAPTPVLGRGRLLTTVHASRPPPAGALAMTA